MTMMDVRPADLTELTDQELALAYGDDGADVAALQAEEDRREAARRRSQNARYARWDRQREWYDAAHEQFLRAERDLNGVLLNRRGIARGIEPFALWTGPWHLAEPYMSWELAEWFAMPGNKRVTVTEYERRQRHERAAEHDQLDRDESNAVRRDTGADRESAQDRGDGRRNAFPGPDARAEDAEADPGARADAGRDAAVRPVIVLTEDDPVTVIPGPDPVEAARARLAQRAAELAAERAQRPVAVPAMRVPAPEAVGPAAVAVRSPDAVMRSRRRDAPDPAELLRQVLESIGLYLMDYVAFPSRAAVVAVALWIVHAAARDQEGNLIWWASPRLILTSSQNGSGKSTLLDLIAILTGSRVGRMVKVTAYGLAQVLGTHHDIALPDDAQLTFGSTGQAAKEIQSVLLGGYTRGGKWVTGKSKGTIENVYGPAAIAGKDSLIREQAASLTDLLARSVIVRMERPDRYMPQVDEDAYDRGAVLCRSLKAITGALQGEFRMAVKDLAREASGQEITDGDGGRTAQIWRQLEAVARVAGGPWPEALAEASRELAAASGDLLTAEDELAGIGAAAGGRSFWDEV